MIEDCSLFYLNMRIDRQTHWPDWSNSVGVFALPTAIMTAAILDAGVDAEIQCPHCGHRIE